MNLKIFTFLLFIVSNIYSEEITLFYVHANPPDIRDIRNYIFGCRENKVDEREVSIIYNINYKEGGNKHDTLIKCIYKYDSTLNSFYLWREYHKDIKTGSFYLLDEAEIKKNLIFNKKVGKKKFNSKISNMVLYYGIDPDLNFKYRLDYPANENNLIFEKLDAFGNIESEDFYNNYYKDTLKIVYNYDYNNKTGKSIEYFQGKKYLRSKLLLNAENKVIKEDFYLLDYSSTDYNKINETNPLSSNFYQFYNNKLLKETIVKSKNTIVTYIYNYKF